MSNTELIIDSNHNEVSIALLNEGVLTELHREKGSNEFSVGDLYMGRVKKVVPSLNAAFIEVGYEKDAFLHYLDLGQNFRTLDKFVQKGRFQDNMPSALDNVSFETELDKEGKITDVLEPGSQISVQVAKEPISSKGPRLSCEATIAGRYLVLVPFSNKVSMSQKIRDPKERERLRRLIKSIKPKNFGVIVRTVAVKKKVAEIHSDLNDLINRWGEMVANLKDSESPERILGEINKTSAILRDLLNPSFNNIHVGDESLANEITTYIKEKAPEKAGIVKAYNGQLPIFEQFGIHKQIKAAFGKKVMLKSGAYLIIEHTEAMHVIDVNSGNRSLSKSQEENALETNMECAEEIARVLRLRDMGGIICVDFIDMQTNENQKKLFEHMRNCMRTDKAKHHVLAPSRFGVVEITRQRVRPETDIKTNETCPVCDGTGEVQATVLLVDEIELAIKNAMTEYTPQKVLVKAHPFVEAYIKKDLWKQQRLWKKEFKKWIKVQPDTTLTLLEFKLLNEKGEELDR